MGLTGLRTCRPHFVRPPQRGSAPMASAKKTADCYPENAGTISPHPLGSRPTKNVVDPTGLEPVTSSMSRKRANQLRYKPEFFNVVGEEGVEPSRPCDQWILNPSCMPFHHSPEFVKQIWRRRPESNRCMGVLQTRPFPLGYVAVNYLRQKTCSSYKAWLHVVKNTCSLKRRRPLTL